jgi:hypothetical protein
MTPETILLRQVHPNFIKNGVVTSQAFRPTPKDEDLLSVYDGDQIDPKTAWQHYTCELSLESKGVLGVTQAQCQEIALPVRADPERFPEHAVIVFTAFERKQIETLAKKLKLHALARGWLFQA